jgi:hypothetical protein
MKCGTWTRGGRTRGVETTHSSWWGSKLGMTDAGVERPGKYVLQTQFNKVATIIHMQEINRQAQKGNNQGLSKYGTIHRKG